MLQRAGAQTPLGRRRVRTYLVGGAVRDEMLGRAISERDWVVVGAREEDMLRRGFTRVGHAFPVFLHPQTGEEHALARTESKVAPGHTGFEFNASPEVDLVTDLRRRDLTINAMAKDAKGALIDPYEGTRDLENRVLRHVSDAFVEDPLRVLRVARFCAQLRDFGFEVAEETLALMRKISKSGELDHLPRERVWGELAKVLQTRWLDVFFRVLGSADCLLPWFAECHFTGKALSTLGDSQRYLPSGAARFAGLAALLDERAAQALTTRLGAPKQHTRAALLVARHAETFRAWQSTDAESAYEAFAALARLKPESARDEVLRVIATITATDSKALQAKTLSFANVRPTEPAAELPSGQEYGRLLREKRIALVKAWLGKGL